MSHTFTRQQLFDLVWSAPTRTVAKQLGISDVGLAKACRRADLQCRRGVTGRSLQLVSRSESRNCRPEVPTCRIGSYSVRTGGAGDPTRLIPVYLSTPDPPIPTFSETLDELAGRLRRQIGTVHRTRHLQDAHPRILNVAAIGYLNCAAIGKRLSCA